MKMHGEEIVMLNESQVGRHLHSVQSNARSQLSFPWAKLCWGVCVSFFLAALLVAILGFGLLALIAWCFRGYC